jgi:N-acetylneuraminate synthase
MNIKINKKIYKPSSKTYFIADIAANHDGSLKKAKELIKLAAESGADAAKFQNFRAETIVSDYGFKSLKNKLSHQSKWKKSVFDVYKNAEVPLTWTKELKETCRKYNIDYFTAPYDLKMLPYLNKFVPAWKVGSGDITWHENILSMANTKKPILIATGASELTEIKDILKKVLKVNKQVVLMQCNTNYTALNKNYDYINLNCLKTFKKIFPNVVLGLSDHTFGSETVLGAISLGAKFIEKHFTDKNELDGPDHKFSMNPSSWSKMIESARKLERSMGISIKKIEFNEKETAVLQRRSIRLSREMKKGEIIRKNDLVYLRPCPKNSLPPYKKNLILNKKIIKNLKFHHPIELKDVK